MNENTSFTKMLLLNSLNAPSDHDVRSSKVDEVKLNAKQRHFKIRDTVQDAVSLQKRKFRQIRSNLVLACSSRPN